MSTRLFKLAAGTALFLFTSMLGSSASVALPTNQDDILKQDMISLLQGGSGIGAISPSRPLYALRRYPLTATTAYLLMENDSALLTQFYPEISRLVMQLFADDNLTAEGLVRGMPGSAQARSSYLSPGFNVLADIELYSLHLIAWRTGAYEDALELLAWSNRLSDLIARSFYDPSRQLFYPLTKSGAFVTAYSPSQLLPLVTDVSLGSSAHARIAGAFIEKGGGLSEAKPKVLDDEDPWQEPFMRTTILDLLSTALDRDGELFATLHASAEKVIPPEGSGQAVWAAFWRQDPSLHKHLFPRWNVVSSLVNLTLLFERESLIQSKEVTPLRTGIDSLVAALSAQSMNLNSYVAATGTVNRLLVQVSRISQLIDSKKEQWRVIDEAKWLRLSPRIKRLITEGCANSISELTRAKSELSRELERECGIAFRLELPARPLLPGKQVEYAATLQVSRDTLAATQFYLQIGNNRWKMKETEQAVRLTPGGAPLRYENKMPLAPTLEPGIVTLPSSIDFLSGGRRVEIHRVESIVLAKEYDAELELPEGRRVREKPVPIEVVLTYRPDHDIEGEVEGTFLREFTSAPPLPARFLVSKDSERTKLALKVAPKGTLSPGRYPFSLTVALDGRPIALLEETLVRPFRWLHLGPLAKSDGALNKGLEYQSDLLKSYTTSDGRTLRWQEVPSPAIDGDGALWPQHLYGAASERCMLLYTAVDAPARMKLTWSIAAKNPISLWINSAPAVLGTEGRNDEMSGSIELRKGPNSFLIATCWNDAPGRISFDLCDENGLPAPGLSNDLNTIVDGYERLATKETAAKKETPPEEQLHEVVLTYGNPDASEVCIIGSFNNWEPGATPMKKWGKGPWTANLTLRPGRYTYKFLVNHKSKIVDPAAKETEPDGFGGTNSVLVVR